ncbi:MAG: rhamnulokinase [Phycisphaerae bacterium]|nr:rhamnulokinase [Phycisphaerae bacterium]
MLNHYLAIDLGASSGRAVLGRLEDDVLTLTEVHRFPNSAVQQNGSLRWDVGAIEREIRRGVQLAADQVDRLGGIGIDSWGVDYVLLDASGSPIEPPFHYRDSRTDGVMDRVCESLGRDFIFARTGIQFLPFNTLFQLAAHDRHKLHHAEGLLMIADYFSHRLGGRPVGEITLASTSQMLDAKTREWAVDLAAGLDLPADLLPELVEAGRITGDIDEIPIIATAAHDTAAAVAGCPADPAGSWAFLSCGTWSIVGLELPDPVLTPDALRYNLSNEAGIAGTTRLLRNIMGLWLLQECRREWAASGDKRDWNDLVAEARHAKPFAAVIDPDDPTFLAPDKMPQRIADYCKRTNQPAPETIVQFVRIILEGLALKTRWALGRLEEVARRYVQTIHLVGGGVNNRLLCQWTADATGRRVLAGPSEATAAGNLLTQAIGAGAIKSIADARRILRNSIDLEEYTPSPSAQWDDAYGKLLTLINRLAV